MEIDNYPLVSVLMPVYNGAKFLPYTIENILNQSYPNIEIIIVDDGSLDNSYSIACSYIGKTNRKIIVISQPNLGAGVARTKAFKESSGDYIMYMDSDDLISSNKIELQVKILQKNDIYTLVSSEWDFFYKDIKEATFPMRPIYKDYLHPVDMLIEMLNKGEMMQTSTWLMSRKLIECIGDWDSRFTINDDGVYFSKALVNASKVCFCQGAYVYYRRGHSSLSTKDIYSVKKIEALFESYKEQSKVLLSCTMTVDAVRGVARNYSLIMCKASYNSSIYNQAKTAIVTLGLKPFHPHQGSKADIISRIIGFENFLKLRSLLCTKKK